MAEQNQIILAPYGMKNGAAAGPNPTQDKINHIVDQWRARDQAMPDDEGKGIPVLYVQGGVRAGKTRGILGVVLELLVEYPGIKILWGRQDFADLRVSAMETFLEVGSRLIVGKNEQEHRYSIMSAGASDREKAYGERSKIYFRELKDISGLGSQEYAVIIITELYEIINYNVYTTLKTRCMQPGYPHMLLMEGNPPLEGQWQDNLTKRGAPEFDDDVTQLIVSTYENWDNLPAAYKRTLEKMPPAWRRKYLEGKSGYIPDGKPFYDGFIPDIHGSQAYEHIPGREIIRCLDFGYHHPGAVWMQLDNDGRMVILRELMGTDIVLEKFTENHLIPFENAVFPGEKFMTYYDIAGRQKTDKADTDCIKILGGFGITGSGKQSTYVARKELIERLLSQTIKGKPCLLVSTRCKIVQEGFMGGYHYPVMKQGRAEKEEPEKDGYYEHLMNCMEYGIVNTFTLPRTKSNESEDYVPFSQRYPVNYR